MERDWEQLRAAVQKLDVITGQRLVSQLERLIDVWPDARNLFDPRIETVIAAIKEHEKAERQKWLERA